MSLPSSLSLPYELERDIFELTARTHQGSAVRLILVARRVHTWIEPILYEVLTIRDPSSNALLDGPLQDRFAKHANTLCLAQITCSEAMSLIPRFHALINLALWTPWESPLLSVLEPHRLRRLSVSPTDLMTPSRTLSFEHPAFSQITHLELLWIQNDWKAVSGVCVLTRLTHLGCMVEDNMQEESLGVVQALQKILSTTVSLQVFAIFVARFAFDAGGIADWLRISEPCDPRLAVLTIDLDESIYSDWEAFTYGKPNMWTRAEDMVSLQKRANSGATTS